MPQKHKKKRVAVQSSLLEMSPQDGVPPKQAAQIKQLLANRQVGPALDLAKRVHKRYANAASETLLVDAHLAWIHALLAKNLSADAKVAIDFVRENHPAFTERLEEVSTLLAAQQGDLDALLHPLNLPTLPPERHAFVAQCVRRYVVDLAALSQCDSLPLEHPWRLAAAALARMFEAVTSGPVEDQALALPEISRGNPLSPWKMLLRAVASFYRHEDELCEKYLAAIEPEAAAARLVPALQALMGKSATLTSATRALATQTGGSLELLRSKLRDLDQALAKPRINQARIAAGIKDAVTACEESCPEALQPLTQLILTRALASDMEAEPVANALGSNAPLKDAGFWRLLARSFEEEKDDPFTIFFACAAWEEFRRHALRQKWFPPKGPEIATLYLHMAGLLDQLPRQDIGSMRQCFAEEFGGNAWLYEDQPAETRSVLLSAKKDLYFTRAEILMERACLADPSSENFRRWLDWSRQNCPAAVADSVAGQWRLALPNDVQPALYLMESAEKTGAFQRAYEFMEIAERLNSLNPEVRKARLRLLVAMALRYLQQKKPKKADKEIAIIESLPQVQQGDRPAFPAALRCVSSLLRGEKETAARARAEVATRLNGELAAHVALTGILRHCKLKLDLLNPETIAASGNMAAQLGRACALGNDMHVPFEIPPAFAEPLLQELTKPGPAIEFPGIEALGQAALRGENLMLAYAISAAGFSGSEAARAQCLFLRAQSLPSWEMDRQEACIGAASELARRQRNVRLLHEIGEWRAKGMDSLPPLDKSAMAMGTEQIERIIQRESKQRAYPAAMPPGMKPGTSRLANRGQCDCPECRAGLSPPLPAELVEMLEELGPEGAARAIEQMLDNISGRPNRKKGKARSKYDFPF